MQQLARVTIHNGSYDEYQALHKHMAAIGFKRYVTAGNGTHYWLPDATYVHTTATSSLADSVTQISRIAAQCAPSKAAPEVFVRGLDNGPLHGPSRRDPSEQTCRSLSDTAGIQLGHISTTLRCLAEQPPNAPRTGPITQSCQTA
ncbi:hypothetical protein ACTMU2_29415 [Cupriavidus basilensis]